MNESFPQLISTIPENNSKNISKNTTITLKFNEPVYTSDNGKIIIKNYKNNNIIEIIKMNSLLIVGSGSNTITIHLSKSLKEFTHYYVLISQNCFKNIKNNFFTGINKALNFNFTTSQNLLPKITNYYISDDYQFIYLSFNKEMFNRRGEKLSTDHFRLNINKGLSQLSSIIPKSIFSKDNITFKIEIEFSNGPYEDDILKIFPYSNNSIFDSSKNPWTDSQIISFKNDIKKNDYKENINFNTNINHVNIQSKILNLNLNNKYNINKNLPQRSNLFFDNNIIPRVFYNSTINRDKKSLINDIVNNPIVAKQVIHFNQLNLNQAFNYKKQGKIYGTTRVPWNLETIKELYMTYNEQVNYYLYITKIPFYKGNFSYLLMQIKNVLSQLAYAKNLYYSNKVISYKPDGSVRTPRQLFNLLQKFVN